MATPMANSKPPPEETETLDFCARSVRTAHTRPDRSNANSARPQEELKPPRPKQPSSCWRIQVISGMQDRMIMLAETGSKLRLRLLRPMFAAKATEIIKTQPTSLAS